MLNTKAIINLILWNVLNNNSCLLTLITKLLSSLLLMYFRFVIGVLPLLTNWDGSMEKAERIIIPEYGRSIVYRSWPWANGWSQYAQLVRPICMTKNVSQEVWQHFLVTPGLAFMEITKSAHSEAVATLTDFEKLHFYYENGRLFPVFQYFHSWNFLIWM